MNTKILMTVSAEFLGVIGIILSFRFFFLVLLIKFRLEVFFLDEKCFHVGMNLFSVEESFFLLDLMLFDPDERFSHVD